MELLKKNYEKVLLGAVLLGLTVGAALLPLMIASERRALDEKSHSILDRPVLPLPPLDLSQASNLLRRVTALNPLNLTDTNKLFNPMTWQKAGDRWIKQPVGGMINLCQVAAVNPLYTIITLDNVYTNDNGARYAIGVVREAAYVPSQRTKKQYYTARDSKTDAFMIRDIKGSAENPVELVMELSDTGETATVAKDRPFRRVDGYTADLKYPPENKTWSNQRVNSIISFAGETYIIVAVSKDEVVLLARSNNKKTPIPFSPAADSH
jgi:hypothetical protein